MCETMKTALRRHVMFFPMIVASKKRRSIEIRCIFTLLRASWKRSFALSMKTALYRSSIIIMFGGIICCCLKSKSVSSTAASNSKNLINGATTAAAAARNQKMSSTTKLPSSMTGPPVSSLVPPGKCQFGEEFLAVPLLERFPVSSTSSVLRFGLPDQTLPLNLSTCACILANAEINGEAIIRPYTPISTNAMIGCFDVLVKNYGPEAKMSRHMHEIKPGSDSVNDMIKFKHIPFNVKIQAPFSYDHICMIVGGTGITPMIQALHAILGEGGGNGNKQKVTMLYGSKVADDILGKELLDQWQVDYADQFTVVHVLSHEPDDSAWKGARGFIDKTMIEKYFPSSSENKDDDSSFCIFVCGPPPMYNALSGPRDEPDSVKGLLGEMGYKPNQVYKF